MLKASRDCHWHKKLLPPICHFLWACCFKCGLSRDAPCTSSKARRLIWSLLAHVLKAEAPK
jgi:hypothetical protein